MGIKDLYRFFCCHLQYLAAICPSPQMSPVSVGGPSTSSDSGSEISFRRCEDVTHSELPSNSAEEMNAMDKSTDTAEVQSISPINIPMAETCDVGCQVNTRGGQLMLKSTRTQTNESLFEVITCDQSTQTEFISDEMASTDTDMDTPDEHEDSETLSP